MYRHFFWFGKISIAVSLLVQCTKPAMSSPWAACGPVEGFVPPSLGFRSGFAVLLSTILSSTFLMQVAFSATLSRMLPLQLGFEHFQYITLLS